MDADCEGVPRYELCADLRFILSRYESQAKRIEELEENYYQLIRAVESKHPNETRHETALRYIELVERQAQEGSEKTLSPSPH